MPRKKQPKRYSGAVKLRERVLSNGSRSLYLDVYHQGKRSYEFLKVYLVGDKNADRETYEIAEKIRARRENEIQSAQLGGLTPSHVKKGNFIAFAETITATKTSSTYRSLLYHLRKQMGEKVRFDQISTKTVEEFRAYLLKEVKPGTAKEYYSKFCYLLDEATKAGKYRESPAHDTERISAPDAERAYLTFDELKKLQGAECSNPEVRRAFFCSVYTGLRRSDLRALTYGMIQGGQIELRQKKTSRMVRIPVGADALRYIGEGATGERVFDLPSDSTLNSVLAIWAARAGIMKTVSIHTARHTFATLTLSAGGDIYTLSKVMGHASVATTQAYAKVIDSKKREMIDLLPSIEE